MRTLPLTNSFTLNYHGKWVEVKPEPVSTLQIFITNRCNLRCKACFYDFNLGKEEICFEEYKSIVLRYLSKVKKVILMGGEPTLHKDIVRMISFNNQHNLETTIYSNGINLRALEDGVDLSKTKIRVGVYGVEDSERPITKLKDTKLPITITYMLRQDNVGGLLEAAKIAENRFNCQGFFISSIRDIETTDDFWKDTEETLPLDEYVEVVQDFLDRYSGNLPKIHVSRRGVIQPASYEDELDTCRFGNIFPDKKKVICPFDISKKIYSDELDYNKKCDKCDTCLLQKIELVRSNE
jgi:MoaA/NifB/PqqE/SkfB family radical SAM enzyme